MTTYSMTAGDVTYPRTPPPPALPKIIIVAKPTAPHNLDVLTVYRDTYLHGSVTVTGTQTTATIYLPAADYDRLAGDLANPGIVQISFDWNAPNVTNWHETRTALTLSAPAIAGLLQQIQASTEGVLPSETAQLIQNWLEVLPPPLPTPDPPPEEPQTLANIANAQTVRFMVEVTVKPVTAGATTVTTATAGTNGKPHGAMVQSLSASPPSR